MRFFLISIGLELDYLSFEWLYLFYIRFDLGLRQLDRILQSSAVDLISG